MMRPDMGKARDEAGGLQVTDRDFDALCAYVRKLADAIGLGHWRFTVKRDPPDDDMAGAKVEPADYKYHADIWVYRDFRNLPPKTQIEYLLHELLHCHLAAAANVVRLDLWESRALSQQTYSFVCETHKRHIEYAVDNLANSLTPMFKPIKWPKTTKGGK